MVALLLQERDHARPPTADQPRPTALRPAHSVNSNLPTIHLKLVSLDSGQPEYYPDHRWDKDTLEAHRKVHTGGWIPGLAQEIARRAAVLRQRRQRQKDSKRVIDEVRRMRGY